MNKYKDTVYQPAKLKPNKYDCQACNKEQEKSRNLKRQEKKNEG
jgi:hypothetical protein